MKITKTTSGSIPLQQFASRVTKVYQAKDTMRSIWDVWCHTAHHAAAVSQVFRVDQCSTELITEIADFSVWLFTLAEKLKGVVGDRSSPHESEQETLIRVKQDCASILWSRYPGICPACYWRRTGGVTQRERAHGFLQPCDCENLDVESDTVDERAKRALKLRSYSSRHDSSRPKSIDQWQAELRRIYTIQLSRMSTDQVISRLLEKTGKVSDALVRMYSFSANRLILGVLTTRQINLEEQLADMFMWVFLLAAKLDLQRELGLVIDRVLSFTPSRPRRTATLSAIVWSRYGSDRLKTFICPHCRSVKCVCQLFIVPVNCSKDELLNIL